VKIEEKVFERRGSVIELVAQCRKSQYSLTLLPAH